MMKIIRDQTSIIVIQYNHFVAQLLFFNKTHRTVRETVNTGTNPYLILGFLTMKFLFTNATNQGASKVGMPASSTSNDRVARYSARDEFLLTFTIFPAQITRSLCLAREVASI